MSLPFREGNEPSFQQLRDSFEFSTANVPLMNDEMKRLFSPPNPFVSALKRAGYVGYIACENGALAGILLSGHYMTGDATWMKMALTVGLIPVGIGSIRQDLKNYLKYCSNQ